MAKQKIATDQIPVQEVVQPVNEQVETIQPEQIPEMTQNPASEQEQAPIPPPQPEPEQKQESEPEPEPTPTPQKAKTPEKSTKETAAAEPEQHKKDILKMYPQYATLYIDRLGGVYAPNTPERIRGNATLYKNPYHKPNSTE